MEPQNNQDSKSAEDSNPENLTELTNSGRILAYDLTDSTAEYGEIQYAPAMKCSGETLISASNPRMFALRSQTYEGEQVCIDG